MCHDRSEETCNISATCLTVCIMGIAPLAHGAFMGTAIIRPIRSSGQLPESSWVRRVHENSKWRPRIVGAGSWVIDGVNRRIRAWLLERREVTGIRLWDLDLPASKLNDSRRRRLS